MNAKIDTKPTTDTTDTTTPAAQPEARKKPVRSPQLLAAGAAIELAKLDASIAKAKETLAEKEAAKKAVVAGLSAEAAVFLERLRGTGKSA